MSDRGTARVKARGQLKLWRFDPRKRSAGLYRTDAFSACFQISPSCNELAPFNPGGSRRTLRAAGNSRLPVILWRLTLPLNDMRDDEIHSAGGFSWYVNCGMPALGELAGVPLHLLFQEADAVIDAWRRGVPIAREMFGPDIEFFPPLWAHISYGHVHSLGCPLKFPEDSDVGCTPIYDSLDEGIRALGRDVDFSRQGLFPHYLDVWRQIRRALPHEHVPFAGFEAEGPITTAWLLRGQGFFTDLYDAPDGAGEFLRLVTDSIIRYKRTIAAINGQTLPPEEAHIADDGAAMIPPGLWPVFVVPLLDRYYTGMGCRRRLAHIENLVPDHLPFLHELGIDLFDPSVSPKLTPALVRDRARIPFLWRLNAMHIRDWPEPRIERWAYESAAQGAAGLFAHIERITCCASGAARIKTFMRTARQIESLLRGGRRRDQLFDS